MLITQKSLVIVIVIIITGLYLKINIYNLQCKFEVSLLEQGSETFLNLLGIWKIGRNYFSLQF